MPLILDVDASPGMASAFVDLLGETRPLQFRPVHVKGDPDQKDDSLPDVTIYDDCPEAARAHRDGVCYTINGRRVDCEGKHALADPRGGRALMLFGLGRHAKPVTVDVQLQYEWDDQFLGGGTDAGCEQLFSPRWP